MLAGPVLADEEIVARFAFLGCNRIGFTELSEDNPSSANRAQLKVTFDELVAMQPRPSHLFLVGDIVTNYAPGGEVLREQLTAWLELYRSTTLASSGIVTVPIVGNHEVLASRQDPETKQWTDYPNPATVPVWNEVLESLLLWTDGPTLEAPNSDLLTVEQSRLSFTLQVDDLFFIVLNTDTFIDDVTIGDIPVHWLTQQLDKADRDEEIEHVFVLGHKPFLRPGLPGYIVREGERQTADRLLGSSPKVRAFLTSHFHLWDHRPLRSGVPQIIAGNAGTAPSGDFNKNGEGYYGYTVIDLLDSGRIVAHNWGRPIPQPYNSEAPQPPATLRATIQLWPR